MNQDRPKWYERARSGPFERSAFDEEKRQTVERRIAERGHERPRYRRRTVIGTSAAAAVCIVLLLVFQLPGETPPGTPEGSPGLMDVADAIVRAEGRTETGTLQVLTTEDETQETLGAPSCLGAETDIRFGGDYQVIYTHGDGSSEWIADLQDMTFIQPTTETVVMSKLSMSEIDIFLLVPEYKDCHGLTFYAYAVDRASEDVFPLSIRLADGMETDKLFYPPGRPPFVRNGQLVIPTSEGPGGESAEGPQDRIFSLDLDARTLVESPH